MTVADVMQREVTCCRPGSTIADVARLMREHELGCVVLTDPDRRVVGLLTDRDIVLRGVANDLAPDLPASRVATHEPVTIHADVTLPDAARQMATRGCRRLPVVDDDRRLVGIVTLDDIVLAAGETLEQVVRTLQLEHHEHARLATYLSRRQVA